MRDPLGLLTAAARIDPVLTQACAQLQTEQAEMRQWISEAQDFIDFVQDEFHTERRWTQAVDDIYGALCDRYQQITGATDGG